MTKRNEGRLRHIIVRIGIDNGKRKKNRITANSNFTHNVVYLVHWPRQTLSLRNHTFDFTSNIIECLPHCKNIGTDFEIFHVAYIVIRYYNLCICVRHLFSMQLGAFCQKREWEEVLPFGMQNTWLLYRFISFRFAAVSNLGFRRVRKIAKSDYQLRYVCISVCPSVFTRGTSRIPQWTDFR